MKKFIILVLILTLLVAFGCTSKNSNEVPLSNEQPVLGENVDEMIVADENEANMMDNSDENIEISSAESAVKEFTIHGSSFMFDPLEIRVKVGDRVKINYVSDDVGHNLVIDELNLRTNIISNGETNTIEFTADRVGNFDMYCSVGQHRDLGMEGQLIVEA